MGRRKRSRIPPEPITVEEIALSQSRHQVPSNYGLTRLDDVSSYVGKTTRWIMRMREHSGDVGRGAKKTSCAWKGKFKKIVSVFPFLCERDAEHFEFAWGIRWTKRPSQMKLHDHKIASCLSPALHGYQKADVVAVLKALCHTLLMSQWTRNAIPFGSELRKGEPVCELHWLIGNPLMYGVDFDAFAQICKRPIRNFYHATPQSVVAAQERYRATLVEKTKGNAIDIKVVVKPTNSIPHPSSRKLCTKKDLPQRFPPRQIFGSIENKKRPRGLAVPKRNNGDVGIYNKKKMKRLKVDMSGRNKQSR